MIPILVSYYAKKTTIETIGNSLRLVKRYPLSFSEIRDLEKTIAEDIKVDNLVIQNIIRLRKC